MRLGGPVLESYDSPEGWVAAVRRRGYRAVPCPVRLGADQDTIQAYAAAAARADIVIAEVGAWNNPLSADAARRDAALRDCQAKLALADEIGALCCVNIAGSRGERWDGPDPGNLTAETFEMIVETARAIVDAVRPKRARYALETMPWMYPDSPQSCLDLMEAIDRPQVGIHLDPVNMVCSPQRYCRNGALIRECFRLAGPYIVACHAKDIVLRETLTTHLDEVCPGQGALDYAAYLGELASLDRDVPLLLEHMQHEEDYVAGATYIRAVAAQIGVAL